MECNMNGTAFTKSIASHSTDALSQCCPSYPALQDGHDFIWWEGAVATAIATAVAATVSAITATISAATTSTTASTVIFADISTSIAVTTNPTKPRPTAAIAAIFSTACTAFTASAAVTTTTYFAFTCSVSVKIVAHHNVLSC
eukprot:11024455-Ditylum_brightwellii.AAC.1